MLICFFLLTNPVMSLLNLLHKFELYGSLTRFLLFFSKLWDQILNSDGRTQPWDRGLHSWFGQCNLLKKCFLPKCFYLFQALPIRIPFRYFKQVHYPFIKFIWAQTPSSSPSSTLASQTIQRPSNPRSWSITRQLILVDTNWTSAK